MIRLKSTNDRSYGLGLVRRGRLVVRWIVEERSRIYRQIIDTRRLCTTVANRISLELKFTYVFSDMFCQANFA